MTVANCIPWVIGTFRVFVVLAWILTGPTVQGQGLTLAVHWDKTVAVLKTTPALQVVVSPLLHPGEPLSTASYAALRQLGADYARYVPWLPYPKLAVVELESPTPQKTSWDFSLIDPMTKEFLAAAATKTEELGVILKTDDKPGDNVPPPQAYWNLAGSLYAYLYIELSRMQIDIAGESQIVSCPTQFPSVSMMDWTTNKPNPRFSVLRPIKDSFHPGDQLVDTLINSAKVEAQAFVTLAGHKLLLVNMRNRVIEVALPDAKEARAMKVDETSGDGPAHSVERVDGKLTLAPFAVTVVSW